MFGYNRRVARQNDRGLMRTRHRASDGTSNETSRLLLENPENTPSGYSHQELDRTAQVASGYDNDDRSNTNASDTDTSDPDTAAQFEEEMTDQITTITNRLRVLFYTLYIPVIPLLTLLVFLLMELISKASKSPSCSYPLRFHSYVSLILFLYLPNHKRIRRWFFNYSRETNHTRPRAVRIYDQCFHMLVIFYIYFDMSLVQSCKDDLDPTGQSTCMATCPELYPSFQRFDLILRIFAGVLVLPMVCLPFAYLWLIRRISAVDTDALVRLGVQLGAERDDLAGGAKVEEVLSGLREVRLEKIPAHKLNPEDDEKVRVVGLNEQSWSGDNLKDWRSSKDCCICMCEFECAGKTRGDDESETTATHNDDVIVETKCGHLFHKNCIGSWIGGQNWEDATITSRARRRNCPLCREDLIVNGADTV